MSETQSSQVRLENRTEHVLHIALAGGAIISVPPSPEDSPAPLTVTFADADERARFEQALSTETVAQWLKDKHLVVHGDGAAPEQSAASGSESRTTGSSGSEFGSAPTSPSIPTTSRTTGSSGSEFGSAPTSPSIPTTPSTPGSKRRGVQE